MLNGQGRVRKPAASPPRNPTRHREHRGSGAMSRSRDFGRRWSTPAMVAGSSPSKWAYFDGRQNHFRACNAIVATRSAWVTARIHLSQYRDKRKCRLGRPNSEILTTGPSDLHQTADLSGLRVYRSCSLQTVKVASRDGDPMVTRRYAGVVPPPAALLLPPRTSLPPPN